MEEKPTKQKFMIYLSEASELDHISLRKEHKVMLDFMRENKYRASALPVSRRSLSHWRTLNIFDVFGNNPEQINISYIVLFWLQIVSELRIFGLSLEKIEKVKETVFSSKKPLIETYMILAIGAKDVDVFMIVSPDADVAIGSKHEIEVSETLGLIEKNYIKINFRILLNRMNKKQKLDIIQQSVFGSFISPEERSILKLIRDGEYKEIKLKFEDGTVTHIEKKVLEQNPDPIKELKKMIASNDGFCEMSLKMQNGKFVVMEKIIKEKP